MKRVKHLFILAVMLLIPSLASAFDNAVFNDLMAKIRAGNYLQVEKFLESNQSTLAKDPEYYVVLLNYVVAKGAKGKTVTENVPESSGIVVKDRAGKEVGAFSNAGKYDEELIADGITRARKALESFRSRLDIQLAIVGAAVRIKRWDIVGDQLDRILEDSIKINNRWVWGPVNAIDGDPKEIMLQNVLSKTSRLFRVNTKEADEALKSVSETLIRLYPKEIYGYANLGTLCLSREDYDCAEQYYNQALKIEPKDKIVLGNLQRIKEIRKDAK